MRWRADRAGTAVRWNRAAIGAPGDPHARTGADPDARVAIDRGVYGVPETFVVDRNGRIACTHIGAITGEVLRERLMPLVEDLRK